jgi:hypothetical protein
MPRHCIFCDQTPVTLEDVWPKWIQELFTHTKVLVVPPVAPRPGGRQARRPYVQRRVECLAKCVCAACNNTWMSDLETNVRPYLGPMIGGQEALILDDSAQVTLTTWAVKTARVVEQTLSLPAGNRYWSADERAAFRMPPHKPPGTPGESSRVRLATYAGLSLAVTWAGATPLHRLSETKPLSVGTRTTMQLGRVVLQVESHRWHKDVGNPGWWSGLKHADRTVDVWLARLVPITWPLSTQPFDEATLKAFAAGDS